MTARKPSADPASRVWQRMLSGRRLNLIESGEPVAKPSERRPPTRRKAT